MQSLIFNQLHTLLWKNFRLRKHNLSHLILEILIPLSMVFILVAVRYSQINYKMELCELKEKQMASMGPIPFLRDFLCTLNTTCYNKTQIDWNSNYSFEFQRLLLNISQIYDNLQKEDLSVASFILWTSNNPNKFNQLNNVLNYISIKTNPLKTAFKLFKSTNQTLFNEGIKIFGNFFCESKNNDFQVLFNNFKFKSRKKRSSLKCRILFQSYFKRSIASFTIYNILAPLIFGKVYYFPKSPFTRKLIRKANLTFKILDDLRLSSVEWRLHFNSYFSNFLVNNSLLKDLGIYCKMFPLKNSNFCKMLNTSLSTENIISILNTMTDVFSFIETVLNCTELNKFVPINSLNEIDNLTNEFMTNLLGIIVFNDSLKYLTTQNATFLSYQIRIPQNRIDSTYKFKVLDAFWTPFPRTNTFKDLKYYTSGFILLQEALDQAFIELITDNESIKVGSSMQIMPYPCFVIDKFINSLSEMLSFILVISWAPSVSILIKNIVYEKENRLKEYMQVMGLTNFVHWLGWFISTITVLILPVIIMSLILRFCDILLISSLSIVFSVLLFYVISLICQTFMISVFFDKANVASVSGGIIYFILYMVSVVFIKMKENLSLKFYYLCGFISQVSFSNAMNSIVRFEISTTGAQFSNLFKGSFGNLDFGIGHCLIMMGVDSIIYLLIAWYIEAVFPGQYGVAKPWYFMITPHYWYFPTVNQNIDEMVPTKIEEILKVKQDNLETEPTDLLLGISIQNLVKFYSQTKIPAINNLNLNFYQSQITAFLGHNGAGKTTTISILTGILSPSSGTAYILNEDIRFYMDSIRQKIGLCPQHNILFDNLTVEDHIYFYGLLKKIKKSEIKDIIPKIIEDVDLTEKIDTLSKNLSGGMKRKLSIAIAFIGNSRIVFLDEPTAGVDPFSRRGIWDLLIKYRSDDRTIILTTHHMDEADYLSDRIAIISQGKLLCCGSSVFLKRKFGEGYYLNLLKNQKSQNENSVYSKNILQFIQQYIHNAKLIDESTTQLRIILPHNDKNMSEFSNLFKVLDKSLIELNIASYGLSDTSLEEVFLKIADDPSNKETSENKKSEGNLNFLKFSKLISFFNFQKLFSNNVSSGLISLKNHNTLLTGLPLLLQQILGLQIKRYHHTKRDMKGLLAELILPVFMILLIISLLKLVDPLKTQQAMVIFPWLMMKNLQNVLLNTFYRKENVTDPLIDELINGYRSDLGESGIRCMNHSIYRLINYECYTENYKNKWIAGPIGTIPKISPACDCNKTGYQICSNPLSGGPENSYRIMTSSDQLNNLTGYNISDYLLKNFNKLNRKLYGGYQFLLPDNFGKSSKLIGELGLWNGFRHSINSSGQNQLESLRFLNYFQEFFNLSGTKMNFTRIWINTKGYVSMPAYANIFSNLLLRSRVASLSTTKNPLNYGISVTNYPLVNYKSNFENRFTAVLFLEVILSIYLILGLSFVSASFVIFLIEERINGSKQQQLVSGINPYVYWISNFLWDITKYLIPVSFIIIIFIAFDYQSYIGSKNIRAFLILLFFYGLAIIPHMYPSSFFISTPSTAFVVLNAYNLMVGSITTISTFFLDILEEDQLSLKLTNDLLKKIFLIFPQYDLGRGMIDLTANYLIYNTSEGLNTYDAFDWETTGKKLYSLVLLFFGWWFVVFVLESGIINRKFCGKVHKNSVKHTVKYDEDYDVSIERERINHEVQSDEVLKVINLTKDYNSSCRFPNQCEEFLIKNQFKSKSKRAVDNLCFGVKEGECFGLLGVNGAGKTTTFKMLTGEENITHGNAFINSCSIINDMIGAHRNMGFCPQFDALHSLLTCEEQLYFYCRIRGIESSQIKSTVELSLKNLSLTPHMYKTTQTLSGGNKRKLSTAIALIGFPKVIFLDEPTSGMDAGARRFLWNIIQKMTNENKIAVILTSHNMEECEVLCHRLSIMVNGEMKCLGSVQHLKSKFGDDYFVKIRLITGKSHENDSEKIQNIINKNFQSGVSFVDENFVTLQYRFDYSAKLSMIFDFFENLKKCEIISDYSISQTSLDDIFINFAKEEHPSKVSSLQNSSEGAFINEGFDRK